MKQQKQSYLSIAKEMQQQIFVGSKAATFFKGKDIFGNIIKIKPNEDLVFFNSTTGKLYMGSLTWITYKYTFMDIDNKKGALIINSQKAYNYNIITRDTDFLLRNLLNNCIMDPSWALEKLAISYLKARFSSKPKIFVGERGKYFKKNEKKPFYYETKYNNSKRTNNKIFEKDGYLVFDNSCIGFICKMDAFKNKKYFLKGFISRIINENSTVNQVVVNDYNLSLGEPKYTHQYTFNNKQRILFSETNHPDCCGQKIIYGHRTDNNCDSDAKAKIFWKDTFNIDEKNIKDLRETLSTIGKKSPIMVHLTDNQLYVNSYLYIKLFGYKNVKKIHTYNNPNGGNHITILQINVYDWNLQETGSIEGNYINDDYIRFVLYWLENLQDEKGVLIHLKKNLVEKTKNIIKKTKKDFFKKVGIGIRGQIELSGCTNTAFNMNFSRTGHIENN